ncbi:hypothetical protein PsorP6_002799 [Peronosclerospora sorghi]|uniref:Uncharacterized protein n=1 Tax=Peronosclerospora sorghi TaxID=230839 RepID=A0ACC0VJT1_9STRA|nr:hypothetical protein PsorP6_002799 [Peronosclerospora sorghi]
MSKEPMSACEAALISFPGTNGGGTCIISSCAQSTDEKNRMRFTSSAPFAPNQPWLSMSGTGIFHTKVHKPNIRSSTNQRSGHRPIDFHSRRVEAFREPNTLESHIGLLTSV